jgi:acyl carrier protein
VPVVVPPAVATLFLGAPDAAGARQLALAFDHAVLNGAGAARYLAALRDGIAEAAAAPAAAPAPARVAASAAPDRLALVVAVVEAILGRPAPPDVPLGDLGLTSAGALKLVDRLNQTLGVRLPQTAVWRYPTARRLAAALPGPERR